MMWRALSRVCGSCVRRMISSAFLIGASGLRSSWARVARNSSLLRSALRSASSTDLREVMSTMVPSMRAGARPLR